MRNVVQMGGRRMKELVGGGRRVSGNLLDIREEKHASFSFMT